MTLVGYKQTEEHIRRRCEHLKGNQYTKGYKWTMEQRENLNRSGKNAPCYKHGRYCENYCINCGAEITPLAERCRSCRSKIEMKKRWQKPEFKKMKSEQAQQQWRGGGMDGVFNNRKIYIESPSNPENKIIKMLEEVGIDYMFQFRPKGYGKIYDFYIPSMNLLIEYDSKYWHSLPGMRERDKEKTEYAQNNGYGLLRFNEDTLDSFKNLVRGDKL